MKNSTLKSLDYWSMSLTSPSSRIGSRDGGLWLKGKNPKVFKSSAKTGFWLLMSWSVSVFPFFKSHKEIDQQIFHLRSRSYGFSLTFNPPNECGEMMCLLFIIFPRLAELSSKFKRCHSFKMTTRNLFATEDFK